MISELIGIFRRISPELKSRLEELEKRYKFSTILEAGINALEKKTENSYDKRIKALLFEIESLLNRIEDVFKRLVEISAKYERILEEFSEIVERYSAYREGYIERLKKEVKNLKIKLKEILRDYKADTGFLINEISRFVTKRRLKEIVKSVNKNILKYENIN